MATLKGNADVSFSLDGKEWTPMGTLQEASMKAKIRKVTMIEVTYGDHQETVRFNDSAADLLSIWMVEHKYGGNIFFCKQDAKRDVPKVYGECTCRHGGYYGISPRDCKFHKKQREVFSRLQRMLLWYIKSSVT